MTFDKRKYDRERKRKLRAMKTVKIINLIPYQNWKKDSSSYYTFKCRCCGQTKDATNYYIGHLRYSKMTSKALKCKDCHNKKREVIIKTYKQRMQEVRDLPNPFGNQEQSVPKHISDLFRKETKFYDYRAKFEAETLQEGTQSRCSRAA